MPRLPNPPPAQAVKDVLKTLKTYELPDGSLDQIRTNLTQIMYQEFEAYMAVTGWLADEDNEAEDA